MCLLYVGGKPKVNQGKTALNWEQRTKSLCVSNLVAADIYNMQGHFNPMLFLQTSTSSHQSRISGFLSNLYNRFENALFRKDQLD